jgi:hypothetical protein
MPRHAVVAERTNPTSSTKAVHSLHEPPQSILLESCLMGYSSESILRMLICTLIVLEMRSSKENRVPILQQGCTFTAKTARINTVRELPNAVVE